MNIELLNPYIMRIIISARARDSIKGVSKRINVSYGWVYKWVKEMAKEGILKEEWRGFSLNEDNENYKETVKIIRKSLQNPKGYYLCLTLMGINYCLTKTDAVYLYTEGMYNIARYKENYPIFIKVRKKDYKLFLEYCNKLKLKINAKGGVYYHVETANDFRFSEKEGFLVEPLDETIRFMKDNIYNFQPALEMIKEAYDVKINAKYKGINGL